MLRRRAILAPLLLAAPAIVIGRSSALAALSDPRKGSSRSLAPPPGMPRLATKLPVLGAWWFGHGGPAPIEISGGRGVVSSTTGSGFGSGTGIPGVYTSFNNAGLITVNEQLTGSWSFISICMRSITAGVGTTEVQEVATQNSGFEFSLGNGFDPAPDIQKPRFSDNGTGVTRGWLNGKKQSAANPFDTAVANGQWNIIGGTMSGGTAGSSLLQFGGVGGPFYLTGGIKMWVAFQGVLPDGLMASLTTDPYQIMEFPQDRIESRLSPPPAVGGVFRTLTTLGVGQ